MVAKKTVKSKPKPKSTTRVKDLSVRKAAAVKGGIIRRLARRSQMSDPCEGEE